MGVNQSVADDGAAQLKENAEYLIRMKTLEVDLDARLKKVEEEAKINREIRLMKLGVNIEGTLSTYYIRYDKFNIFVISTL